MTSGSHVRFVTIGAQIIVVTDEALVPLSGKISLETRITADPCGATKQPKPNDYYYNPKPY